MKRRYEMNRRLKILTTCSVVAVLILVVTLLLPVRADISAAVGTKTASNLPTKVEMLEKLQQATKERSQADLALPDGPGNPPHGLTAETNEAYQTSLKHYYEYRIQGYEHRLEVFEWQLLSSKVIFFVVLLLVFSGIYFAAIQFHSELKRKQNRNGNEPHADPTELEINAKGIKVSSSVLGVIILVISLAFFYVYLVHVYPIKDVF